MIKINEARKYNLSYSAGALLSQAFDAVINESKDLNLLVQGEEKIDYSVIPANAESSKKRYLLEIIGRLDEMPIAVLEYYLTASDQSKKIIQFYAICRRYKIITEFMVEMLRSKYLNLNFELESFDYKSFLLNKLAQTDDLDQVTEKTIYKLTQVFFKMLKELDMFSNDTFKKIEVSPSLMKVIYESGDAWFLDVMLLTDDEKGEVL